MDHASGRPVHRIDRYEVAGLVLRYWWIPAALWLVLSVWLASGLAAR